MHRVEASIELAAPAAAVFPWLLEPERRLRWVDGLATSERLGEGRFREVVSGLGRRSEVEVEVVRCEPPRLLVARMRSRDFEATLVDRLEETRSGTRLTIAVEPELRSLSARLGAPVVVRALRHSLERSLETLARLATVGE